MENNSPEDKGCGMAILMMFFSFAILYAMYRTVLIKDEHPLLAIIIILVLVGLAIFVQALMAVWFPNLTRQQEEKRNEKYNRNHGAVCPYCKSSDTYKISNISKGIAYGVLGKYALPRNCKQWHCNNCHSDF